MLDIQLEPPKFLTGAQSPVWLDHEPITATTQRFFSEKATASQSVSDLPPTIDASLTAARLVADYGIQMVRTSNLAEHLTINNWNPKRRVLRVFEHKVWVLNHMLSPETSPLPSDVLEELMRTFHLLFPTMDDATDLLLRKHGMADSVYALGLCGKDRSLSWSNYQYWLKDILNLNSVLSEAPQGARQLLRVDNKDKNSLLNVVLFWVSGMVAFLTIVSTVCGAWAISLAIESKDISVKSLDVSIKSMDISIKGLELAIAQACADPEIAPKLTQYCHPS
ncbi:hypothetical protein QBC35DRAFT_391316 [Podospora australis]|uniref:Uncharacterized protein n=1 Tax=Podospora australis TaxID=1536484 RepID=A0AAN6WMZ5_9PEZI|nr:hypothetical protein QBC35DRAFT_391316 [Podospora australis]